MKTTNNNFATILLVLIVTVFQYSCKIQQGFKTAVIPSGERVYAYDSTVGVGLKRYLINSTTVATIREEGDALYISSIGRGVTGAGNNITLTSLVMAQPLSELRATTFPPNYLFSAREARYDKFEGGFRYRQVKPYLQGIAIAVKFRGPVGNTLSQAEAGSAFALGGGFKNSWIKYKGSKNALGFSSRAWSTSFGLLVGGGTATLKASSTQGKVPDTQATTNFTIPVGLHLVGGYNNINLGLATGYDLITGPNREHWNYKGKPWIAILVGLDIIK